jgi:hypothetical protein
MKLSMAFASCVRELGPTGEYVLDKPSVANIGVGHLWAWPDICRLTRSMAMVSKERKGVRIMSLLLVGMMKHIFRSDSSRW